MEYFHVVFTIPEQLNALALQNKAALYRILFQASAQTLLTIAASRRHLGPRIGFFSILHTRGQNLLLHPHLHCVVTGGGLSADGASWVSCRPGSFLSVHVLSRLFRHLFLEALDKAFRNGKLSFHGKLEELGETRQFQPLLDTLRAMEWVVYAKPPFGGPAQVLDYLGRYTHRVAISNNRLLSEDQEQVRFRYKNYRAHHSQQKRTMTLAAAEFIRRFLLHTVPPGFQRIRHYGLLASRAKRSTLNHCRPAWRGAQRPAAYPRRHRFEPARACSSAHNAVSVKCCASRRSRLSWRPWSGGLIPRETADPASPCCPLNLLPEGGPRTVRDGANHQFQGRAASWQLHPNPTIPLPQSESPSVNLANHHLPAQFHQPRTKQYP